jgi:SAM-dependent methyltransferase
MKSTTYTESSQIASKFQQTASALRPKPGLTTLRVNISRSIALLITNLIQKSGFNKKILSKANKLPVILNIGCADHLDPNYVNADIFPPVGRALRMLAGHESIKWNLFVNIICQDISLVECADGIVFAHVLEHLPPDQTLAVLGNCFQYLKPGGHIRLSVPHIRAYPYSNAVSSQQKAMNAIERNKIIYGHFHQFMYEPELLIALLENVGFSDVKQVDYGEGLLANSDRLERAFETIYITASRPS